MSDNTKQQYSITVNYECRQVAMDQYSEDQLNYDICHNEWNEKWTGFGVQGMNWTVCHVATVVSKTVHLHTLSAKGSDREGQTDRLQ